MFQFTHPGRGATVGRLGAIETDGVSIHAPREGCDTSIYFFIHYLLKFQFTHPGRGATQRVGAFVVVTLVVSIHAPREGCDSEGRCLRSRHACSFNSRTPGGVRLSLATSTACFKRFQFTHPGRGATVVGPYSPQPKYRFQFTHPGRGATIPSRNINSRKVGFNSRTPGGVRPSRIPIIPESVCFNSRTPGGVRLHKTHTLEEIMMFQFTHPGRGATNRSRFSDRLRDGFNSRTPGGVRRQQPYLQHQPYMVSIHAPREGCDPVPYFGYCLVGWFQFTHPGRGATSKP